MTGSELSYSSIILKYRNLCRQTLEKKRYDALEKWTEALQGVHIATLSKMGRSVMDAAIPPEAFQTMSVVQ